MRAVALALTAVTLLALAACGGSEEPGGENPTSSGTAEDAAAPALPQGSEPFALDPADFVSAIDNPYWPMAPGSRWVYRETDGKGGVMKVVVTVTDRTKTIEAIAATVVHDVVSEDGKVVEDMDWYAQDRWGNVWYLGEDTTEYETARRARRASWEAGVDGAQAGQILPIRPRSARPTARSTTPARRRTRARSSASTSTPRCRSAHSKVLMTKDWTPLEPKLVEHKFYAQGVAGARPSPCPAGPTERFLSFEPGG